MLRSFYIAGVNQENRTPVGTDGFYQAIGWLGEKHVYLQGNRLAKIIYEQNATGDCQLNKCKRYRWQAGLD